MDIDRKLPEKAAVRGLQMVKVQARRERSDAIGGVARLTLRIFNASFRTIARTATRLEQASALNGHRQSETAPDPRRSRARAARRRTA